MIETRNSPSRSHFKLGAWLYIIAAVQYFVAQVIVAAAWSPAHPYSWANNYISDLGNTACGTLAVSSHGASMYVCSPDSALMNASFVLLGVLLIAGTILMRRFWPSQGKLVMSGIVLLVIAGIGKSIVGFVPENTIPSLHSLAALNIPVTSIAILLLSVALLRDRAQGRRALAWAGIVAAVIGLIAVLLFGAAERGHAAALLGLGIGSMERLAGYPSDLWMILVGVGVLIELAV